MIPNLRHRRFAAATVALLLALAGCDDATTPIPVAEIVVDAPTTFVDAGQTLQLSATARDASGSPLEGVRFNWTSSNEAVATVIEGLVTAVAPGTATIVSSAGNQQGRIDITVELAVGSVAFEPGQVTFSSGKAVQITRPTPDHVANALAPVLLVMRDAAGNVIPQHSVRFATTDPAVARVSEAGQIEMVAPGTARIVATAGQASGELTVQVLRPYSLVSLGTLGGAESRANGINENGQVVGETCTAEQCRVPFLWDNGTMTALEGGGAAHGINDAGIVVGRSNANQAVMWQGGELFVLYGVASPDGRTYAWAYDINRTGEIVGARIGGFCTRACPWNGFQWRNGELVEFNVFAHAINNSGQTVGFRYINMATPQAVILEGGQVRDLAPLGSAAYDINDRGEAVGFSTEQSGSPAFRWHNGVATNLGVLKGRNLGRAYSINNGGQIVGASGGIGADFSMGSPRAFIWGDGRMVDLNNLFVDETWVFEEARGINDRGQIVGTGRNRTTGAVGALLLNPPQ